jgi:hypothetical protein
LKPNAGAKRKRRKNAKPGKRKIESVGCARRPLKFSVGLLLKRKLNGHGGIERLNAWTLQDVKQKSKRIWSDDDDRRVRLKNTRQGCLSNSQQGAQSVQMLQLWAARNRSYKIVNATLPSLIRKSPLRLVL